MKLQFLGSAAAEGIPALFCGCGVCRRAAVERGKNIRFRSGALLNDHILLDLTPDIYAQTLRFGLDLSKVDALFVTHSHTDHLDTGELVKRSTANYCHIPEEKPLDVYGNEKVRYLIQQALELEFGSYSDASLALHVLEPGKPVVLEDLRITPFPAVHDPKEQCFLYLLEEPGGASALYANDTGMLPEETLAAVAAALNGKRLAMVSMDCTFGPHSRDYPGHMGAEENLRLREALTRKGCMDESTACYVTHFSHNCGMSHQELESFFAPKGFSVVHDGLCVTVSSGKAG